MDSVISYLRKTSASDADYHSFFKPVENFQALDETDLWLSIGQQFVDDSHSSVYCLGESLPSLAPVIIMGRLIFSGKTPGRVQDLGLHEFVLRLVSTYQQVLERYLVLPEEESLKKISLSAGIQMPPWNGFEAADVGFQVRFRIQFFNIKVKVSEQAIIRDRVIATLLESGVKSSLKRELADGYNPWEMILTDSTKVRFVPVYGSVTEEHHKPLYHEELVGMLTEESILNQDYGVFELDDVFRLENHALIANGTIAFQTVLHDQAFSNSQEARFPLLYSTRYAATTVKTHPSLFEEPSERSRSNTSCNSGSIQIVQDLMSMISVDRCMNKGDWERIGQVLYYEFKTIGAAEDGLDEWINFTVAGERSPFTGEDCEEMYHTFHQAFRTRKTLAYYARKDSPDQYRCWKLAWVKEALLMATDKKTEERLADAFYRLKWEEFLYDGKYWWHFEHHTWHGMGEDLFRKALSNRQSGLYRAFSDLEAELSREAARLSDNHKTERDVLDQRKAVIQGIYTWLEKPRSQNSIMEAARKHFTVSEFSRLSDTNFYLMACDDCVIDTSGGDPVLRDGMPEDWLSISTGHMLQCRPYLNYESKSVKEVLYWFEQLFPNREMNHLAWMITASLIQGGNPHKKVIPLVGPTHGGKSGFVDGLRRAMGPYAGIMHSSELTGSKQRGGDDATPSRLQMKYCNMLSCAEMKGTGKGGKWSWELVNRLSGGDDESGRALYQGMNGHDSRSITFAQRQKTFVHTNSVPKVEENADNSTRERLDTWLLFEARFDYNAPREVDEQFRQKMFPRDDDFKQKLNKWARALLWLMVQKFPEYRRIRYPVPEASRKKAEDYWNECDIYSQFIRSRIEKVDQAEWEADQEELEETDRSDPPLLELGSLYPLFSEWYKTRNPGVRIPISSDFKQGLTERIGEQESDGGWLWWQLKQQAKRNQPRAGPMRF